MKICKQCKVSKQEIEFYSHYQKGKNGQTWQYYDSYCKQCRLDYSINRAIKIKKEAIEYLGGKCSDCGLIDEPCVYDFHHIDPTLKEISFGNRGGKSFNSLKPELDKCILLCANCHRKKHSKLIL